MASQALGILETRGLVALMEGTDAMLKSANVQMIGYDKAGSGLVSAFIVGAIDSGAESAGRVGEVVAVHVIPRPHDELSNLLPKKSPAKK
jgi:microcompartment protein CcmL/EutN